MSQPPRNHLFSIQLSPFGELLKTVSVVLSQWDLCQNRRCWGNQRLFYERGTIFGYSSLLHVYKKLIWHRQPSDVWHSSIGRDWQRHPTDSETNFGHSKEYGAQSDTMPRLPHQTTREGEEEQSDEKLRWAYNDINFLYGSVWMVDNDNCRSDYFVLAYGP